MRYLLEHRGDYYGILNEASDAYVAYVHPQQRSAHGERYRVVNREGTEITIVRSLNAALAGFVAHVSAHPTQWKTKSAREYEKDTYYGDTLRVRQNRAGGWSAYRDDRELFDSNGPVNFPSAGDAQRLADRHMGDGYRDSSCPTDGLRWSGANGPALYRIGEELGETVAAAVCAIARSLVQRSSGASQTEVHQTAADFLARLYAILGVSHIGSFDTERCSREPYFLAPRSDKGDRPLRMAFEDAVQHYGAIALRRRLGPDLGKAILGELISWPLRGLVCSCDYLLRAA
jgi:hypothetical protein